MFHSRPARKVRADRPRLEVLEDRALLSTFLVDRLTDRESGSGLAGSLRYCMNQATDGDIITFGVTGTITVGVIAGELFPTLTHSITIQGPGANLLTLQKADFLDAFPPIESIFTLAAGATVSISGLTISGSVATVPTFGGGISNNGTLTISDCTITHNYAIAGGGLGGGIYNQGVLTITNSTVADNGFYDNFPTQVYNQGGGIYNSGTLIVTNSTISGNFAFDNGGGIYSDGGTVTVSNTTISGNAADNGGGIYRAGGTVTVTDSTISGNRAAITGGRVGRGGGISGTLNMRNTILAGNQAYSQYPDLQGSLASSGYNLIGNTTGGSGFVSTDLRNVNPLLGPLQANGGPTQTMALLAGSPALNAGDPAQLGVADQRGVVRSGGVNIGAYQASASAFVLSLPGPASAGTPFDLLVRAVDAFGQTALGYAGTVTFATDDPDAGLPADYAFSAADAGRHTFAGAVILYADGSTVTVTDTTLGTLSGSLVIPLS
jgi:hypothetical protein